MKAELIEVLGSDARVVDAARVSFSKDSSNYTEEQNTRLISYLAKHNHFTPFTHVQITMREKVPIFVARQRFKHRIGFEYNEVSRRYVDDAPEFYVPDAWRLKSKDKKQGSEGEHQDSGYFSQEYKEFIRDCEEFYKALIRDEVAPEQARMVLPQSMYTEYYATGSLYAWANAYKLRSSDDAQKEIRDLAEQWNEIIGGIPELKHSWRALIGKETT